MRAKHKAPLLKRGESGEAAGGILSIGQGIPPTSHTLGHLPKGELAQPREIGLGH